MEHYSPFPTPICKYSLESWSRHKDRILTLINDLPFYEEEGLYTDYYTNCKLYDEKKRPSYYHDVVEVLQPVLDEFSHMYPKEVIIKEMWAQRYTTKNYHAPHNHGPLGYSAVFYAQFANDHEVYHFYSSHLDYITGEHLEFTPKVSEGDIVFFPSAILHQCKAVQSDTDRIIFSFNIEA